MTSIVTLLGLALLGGLLWLIVRQIRNVRANQAQGMRELQKRLIQPDWEVYAAHLQRPVPEEFKALYGEYALLLSELELPLSEDLLLTEMYPLDARALAEQAEFHVDAVPFTYLPFATCAGRELFLRPGKAASNSVYILEFEAGSKARHKAQQETMTPENHESSNQTTQDSAFANDCWRELYPDVATLRAAIGASVAAHGAGRDSD